MFELRRTIPAGWAHVGVMDLEIGPRDVRRAGEYLCIGDLAPTHGRPVMCNINGQWISRFDWWRPVEPRMSIVFVEAAGGGGGNSARTVLTLVALVVSFWIIGPSALNLAAGSLEAGATQAAFLVASQLAINALVPLPGLNGGFSAQDTSPTYTVALQGNQARLGQPIPVRYGYELVFPDFASQPYSEYADNNDQFYCAAFCWGMEEGEIVQITIDDTDLTHFDDVTALRVGPGQSTRAGPYAGVETFTEQTIVATGMTTSLEVSGQDVKTSEWIGPFTVCKAGTTISALFFDLVCPRGLGNIALASGDISDYSIVWEPAYRRINNAGQPIGAWTSLGAQTLTDHTQGQVRRSVRFSVPAGRYQVQLRRVSAWSDHSDHLNDLTWAGLRGLINGAGIRRTDITGIVIRIRANEQLSGLSQRRIKILGRRLLNLYQGGTTQEWSDTAVFTRNPADALMDVWHNTTYGHGLPDDRIDLETLLELREICAERKDHFDYSLDARMTTDDAAQLVARTMRAKTIPRRGSVMTAVRDQLQDTPVAAFMPRNMDEDSFQLSFVLPTEETTDAVAITYRDGRYWDDRVIYGQWDVDGVHVYEEGARPATVAEPVNVDEITFPGVTDRFHIMREAAYLIKASVARRESATFNTDLDGMALTTYGALIAIAHDVASWGQSGDVVSIDGLAFTLSEPVAFGTGTNYIRIIGDVGKPGPAVVVTATDDPYVVLLAESAGVTFTTGGAERERTRYLFGSLADVQRYALVVGLRPTDERTVAMSVVMEDDRVHTADAPWLGMEEAVDITQPDDGGSLPVPGVVRLTSRTVSGYMTNVSELEPYVRLNNDGRLSIPTDDPSDEWLLPQPVTTLTAGLYDVRADFIDGHRFDPLTNTTIDLAAPVVQGSALGAWLSLDTDREWSLIPTSVDTVRIRLRIRDAATHTQQARVIVTLQVNDLRSAP